MKKLLYLFFAIVTLTNCKKELHNELPSTEMPTDTSVENVTDSTPPDADLSFSLEKFSWEKGDYYFENKNSGYRLVRFNILEKTTNGGQNWQPVREFMGYQNYVSGLYCAFGDTVCLAFYFCDYSNGCGDCNSKLFRTENGGLSWEENGTILNARQVYFISGTRGIFVNDKNEIFRTSDGGKNYTEILEKDDATQKIAVISKSIFVFRTSDVQISTDFGDNWKTHSLPYPLFGFNRFFSPRPGVFVPSTNLESSLFLLKNNFSEVEIIELPGSSIQNDLFGNGGFCLMDSTFEDISCACRKRVLNITRNGGATWDETNVIEANAELISFNQEQFPVQFQHLSNGDIYKLIIK